MKHPGGSIATAQRKQRYIVPTVAFVLMLVGGSALAQAPSAPAPGDPKTFPRMASGKPDFTGLWRAIGRGFADPGDPPAPLTPEYAAKRQKWQQAERDGKPLADSVSQCIAVGVARSMRLGNLEFIQRPEQLTIINENLHEVRRIFLDGRKQPEDPDPTFSGHSIGRWNADTLVADTIAIRSHALDSTGLWISDDARLTERISMVNRNTLKHEMTIIDPVALTKPWVVHRYYSRLPPDEAIEEYVCENNRNLADENGVQTAKP